MSSFLPLFLSNHSLCRDFPVPGGKSAEHFGGVRYMWEPLLMIHSTKPAPFHHSWCMSPYEKTNSHFNFFPESAVFFLKSNFKLRDMENSSLSYPASFQLSGLCSKPCNNYLFSCWKKFYNKLIFPIYTQSSILTGSQSTLYENIGTSFCTCGRLALAKIKHVPLPLLLRENISVADSEKENWSEWMKYMTASTSAVQPFNMADRKQQLFQFLATTLNTWLGQEVTKTSVSGQIQEGLRTKNIITQYFVQMRF